MAYLVTLVTVSKVYPPLVGILSEGNSQCRPSRGLKVICSYCPQVGVGLKYIEGLPYLGHLVDRVDGIVVAHG